MSGQLGTAAAVPEAASSVVHFELSRTQKTTKSTLPHEHYREAYQARVRMLALAEQLNNVSAACRRAGISPAHEIRNQEAFEKLGAEGLGPRTRRKRCMPNQTPTELEAQILEMTERYPTYSYLRISHHLKLVVSACLLSPCGPCGSVAA